MRARQPDDQGHVEVDGVRIGWERHGDTGPAILLLPTWTIVDIRFWKGQLAHLARHHRVVVFDGPGHGRSDRPADPKAYVISRLVDAALAVMDATDTPAAVVVSLSMGASVSIELAHRAPERVRGQVLLAPSAMVDDVDRDDVGGPEYFARTIDELVADYDGFVEDFFPAVFVEPHSTKHVEDGIRWALETTPEVLGVKDESWQYDADPATRRAWCESVQAPSLVVIGTADRIFPPVLQRSLASALGAEVVELEGCGHNPGARWPVLVNRLIDRFATGLGPEESSAPDTTAAVAPPRLVEKSEAASDEGPTPRVWTPRAARGPRALYLSSPIGLGHVNRDMAIVRELRALHEDLQIDWLSQDPVTGVLEQGGERVHPASRWLANESAHITDEAHGHGVHGLHAFQAMRRMDGILVANFMVFQEVVEEGDYDLVIGDEAWDVDHFWHEHPELKRGAHVWLTDFVGYVPMDSGGGLEEALTADYNAEMVELVAASPRLRDRSVFVGNPDDVITDPLGPGLPSTRAWTEDNFAFSGYITGFTPPTPDEGAALREELGYHPDERVCIVAVGGSGVGEPVLHRAIDAFPLARWRVPGLRMVVVAGPRIDPASLPRHDGVELRGYVPALHRHLSVCDLAIVQGGLTTTMELTAAKRPFISFPLRDHFEQQVHVRHRLERYRAGRTMDFATTDADALADAIVQELDRSIAYRDVETDGATRAAALIAELI